MSDTPKMLAARVALCAVALIVAAWFALGAYDAHEQARAAALQNTLVTPTPARTAEILRALDRARTLNPDRSVDLARAQALIRAKRDGEAVRILEKLVRDEPRNINAWVLLQLASAKRDPALTARAVAAVRALAPPVAPAPK
jgi:predicted Zn-dependent protease